MGVRKNGQSLVSLASVQSPLVTYCQDSTAGTEASSTLFTGLVTQPDEEFQPFIKAKQTSLFSEVIFVIFPDVSVSMMIGKERSRCSVLVRCDCPKGHQVHWTWVSRFISCHAETTRELRTHHLNFQKQTVTLQNIPS